MLIEFDETVVTMDGRQRLSVPRLILSERRIGIAGPNGAGKSTFSRLINGLLLPDQGRVRVNGLDTRRDAQAIRRQVGFVFQNPDNQIVFPIVREDLDFGLKPLGLPSAERAMRVSAQLASLGISALADRSSFSLSGGERQLVALAAVLVRDPALIVFDEPTTQLDLRNRNRVRDAIAALAPMAIVVSHDLELLADFDRVLVIDDGCIAADDQPAAALRWYREHCS
ncbi:ABC transporter ATP-binding protein [Bordetella avium]|uniref:energy-coupling factor ABC transporter ATP-binding protein n=1 Tax=Bordetella avium TaxID=521 RepID=UPI000E68B3F7|nr:ABC transporter ATP-binding protein [Bordetella avium]RIQ17044.1 ABC transporter ATP-binding protein [Bordetella avium]RIQ36229.1 ABC transporter ATP-binding protein [Bordetella avium]